MLVPRNQRRNIEILKIRFGEAALQVCEVMLKDMMAMSNLRKLFAVLFFPLKLETDV